MKTFIKLTQVSGKDKKEIPIYIDISEIIVVVEMLIYFTETHRKEDDGWIGSQIYVRNTYFNVKEDATWIMQYLKIEGKE